MKNKLRVALVGNPNTGKSTIFNALTGLNQKVGNFPGVTVDKKTGFTRLEDGSKIEISIYQELIVYILKVQMKPSFLKYFLIKLIHLFLI